MINPALDSQLESANDLSANHVRRLGRSPADPLAGATRMLSVASLAWLADGGYFQPRDGSPLATLAGPSSWCSAAARQRAGARLLANDPFRSGARLVAQRLRLSPLGQALAVLEQPEARLRVAIAEPHRMPRVWQFFVRGRLAVAGESDPEGFRLGEPVRLSTLLQALAVRLDASRLGPEMEAVALLPEVFELLTALWKTLGRAVDQPLTEVRLLALLGGVSDGRGQGRSLLAAMVAAELLERRDDAYFLAPALARWLALVWSDHVVEIERLDLSSSEGSGPTPERLIFAGPWGERVLCEELANPGTDGAAPVLLFLRLEPWELEQRLARYLSGQDEGGILRAPAAGERRREAERTGRLPWSASLSVH